MASHALSVLHVLPSASQSCNNSSRRSLSIPLILKSDSLVSCFIGNKVSDRSSNLRYHTLKQRRSTVATVLFSLPTTKPERAASGKAPKWSARAIKSFAMAELEARKLKYPNTGTEALVMGILVEGTSLAAKALRKSGVTLFKVREETVKLLGKSDMYFFSPEHPPLTEPAQRALDWAVEEKLKSGEEDGEITTAHLLLGIWSEKESAGHKIMAELGFDDDKAKGLAKSMNKDIVLNSK
ncbi:unnamed protein product [Ilex paraguariensis]|uniref:Clp R domain-containing protein n=1 Tax=Ilex paraguariensis TaxID=185542 RepID=A0ABC8SV27_9AQUA